MNRSSDTNGPVRPRRAAMVFIFVTVVLDMIALGMIVPVLPKLIEDFFHGNTARDGNGRDHHQRAGEQAISGARVRGEGQFRKHLVDRHLHRLNESHGARALDDRGAAGLQS